MGFRAQQFTSSGSFVVPVGVGSVFVTLEAAGGGGGPSDGLTGAPSCGGGSGEFCGKRPFKVTSGETLIVTVGIKGGGGSVGQHKGGNGTASSIQGDSGIMTTAPGYGGGNNNPTQAAIPASAGGGNRGNRWDQVGNYPAFAGGVGLKESNCYFGGSGGGGILTASAGQPGLVGGGWAPISGGAGGSGFPSFSGGGAGGGSTFYGQGAQGGDGGDHLPPLPITPADPTHFGVGGGGVGGWNTTLAGGDGAGGYVLIQWVG
jgi:hypothetical protein